MTEKSRQYARALREFFLCVCKSCCRACPDRKRIKRERQQHTRIADLRGRTKKR